MYKYYFDIAFMECKSTVTCLMYWNGVCQYKSFVWGGLMKFRFEVCSVEIAFCSVCECFCSNLISLCN